MEAERRSFTVKASRILRQLETPCFVAESSTNERATARSPTRQFSCLWDTGATFTTVSQRVVDDLDLQVDGYISLQHAGGETKGVPFYHIDLLLYNNVQIVDIRVGLIEVRDVDVIIGMDIINRGDFAVSNRNGATSFSFRIPSVEDFDFAAADNL